MHVVVNETETSIGERAWIIVTALDMFCYSWMPKQAGDVIVNASEEETKL